MYQHDLSEKVLDEKLDKTSIDAVAEVGVDANTCSVAILCKVPSLTSKLSAKIVKARPLKTRNDLLKISGLGPITFRNCAAFVRVSGGSEPLDGTLVHPESYDLARWLLMELRWKLADASSILRDERREDWKAVATKASGIFQVSEDRVLTVIDHLYFSIECPDPRLQETKAIKATTTARSLAGCASLPSHVSTIEELRKQNLPLRNIVGTIRNVVDFGCFVDIGLENDGLLHRSKTGGAPLGSFLVGQDIGVDILGIAEKNKISVGLSGLDLEADKRESKRPLKSHVTKPQGKRQRQG
jgi:uncharacterized protein